MSEDYIPAWPAQSHMLLWVCCIPNIQYNRPLLKLNNHMHWLLPWPRTWGSASHLSERHSEEGSSNTYGMHHRMNRTEASSLPRLRDHRDCTCTDQPININ
jgi:hypothetical protein